MSTNYDNTWIVVNSTGSSISNVSITHKCADKTDTIAPGTIGVGQVSNVAPLHTVSGSKDYWEGSFILNGETKEFSDKRLNMPNQSNLCAVVMLREDDYDVFTPDGSGSENNGYD